VVEKAARPRHAEREFLTRRDSSIDARRTIRAIRRDGGPVQYTRKDLGASHNLLVDPSATRSLLDLQKIAVSYVWRAAGHRPPARVALVRYGCSRASNSIASAFVRSML
jgi:hypothetical protein